MRSNICRALWCVLALGLEAVAVQAQPTAAFGARPAPLALPRLGEAGGLDLAAERRMGDRLAQQILRSPDHLDDPVLGAYLESLWTPLLEAARQRGDLSPELSERFAWELMLIRDRSVNAFALPGGYLGVHLGLMASVGAADELASVLAHELSHVTQRHISRLVARQDQQTVWVVGAMILGALAASAARNTDIMQAAVVGGQAVAAQTHLNFSRDMEREADRVGHGVLTGAGYEGAAFVRMFERLQQAARLNDDGSFPYLRSHPLTTERMADMKARQPLAEARGGGVSSPQAGAAAQAWHALMAARARVLAEQDVPRLRAWVEQAQRLPVRVGEHAVRYAGALSALRLKEPLAALVLAQGLVDEAPPGAESRRAVLHLMLEIGLSPGGMQGATVGAPGAAQQALRTLWPDMARQALGAPDRASVLLGAQAALALGEAAAVSQRLQVWLVGRPSDATGWELLAQAWQAQHHPLRALRAQAEARVAVHDTAGAVDRLRAAQDLARAQPDLDPIEQAIIDARQRELQQRLRELAQEKGV